METLDPCCAGWDVPKETVVAWVRCVAPDGRVTKPLRSFDTFTDDLLALADWLATRGRPGSLWSLPASIGSRSGTSWRPTAASS